MNDYRTIRIREEIAARLDERKDDIVRRTGRKPSTTTMIKEWLDVLKSERTSVCPYCKSMTYGGCSHLLFFPEKSATKTEQVLTADEIEWLDSYRNAKGAQEQWVYDIIKNQRGIIRAISKHVARHGHNLGSSDVNKVA